MTAAPSARRIRIFDTTLRDGEQSPGASLNVQEKIEIARQLEAMGVDVIEAGFPITSQGDFDAVRLIGEELQNTTVCGLARCVSADIDRAGRALQSAKHPRIHVFCATSKIHREHKLKKAFEQIVELAVHSVKQARGYVEDVEFSPEDGSRTEMNYLVDITAAAVEAGATTINIPDTVGYTVPAEYGRIFAELRRQLPQLDQNNIVLSAHCHNDLGLAVANSLAAIENGAGQVECTINGIGERAGNASLEEIVMTLKTRRDFYNRYETRIDTKRIFPVSRMVSNLTGLHVQRNKAIVGENAFAHEAGIHQDGVLKHRETYEIMNPVGHRRAAEQARARQTFRPTRAPRPHRADGLPHRRGHAGTDLRRLQKAGGQEEGCIRRRYRSASRSAASKERGRCGSWSGFRCNRARA